MRSFLSEKPRAEAQKELFKNVDSYQFPEDFGKYIKIQKDDDFVEVRIKKAGTSFLRFELSTFLRKLKVRLVNKQIATFHKKYESQFENQIRDLIL